MNDSTEHPTILQLVGICKHFGGTQALDDVDFDLQAGEIHCLLGENGAGKSTLIKILTGAYEADGGEFFWYGEPIRNVRQIPVSVIHQDLALVESLTVSENVGLVCGFPKVGPFIRWGSQAQRTQGLLDRVGCRIEPHRVVSSLSAAEKSLVALARTLALDSEVIILDEPTATLPFSDVDRLFTSLKELRSHGTGIVYVTHRLNEVFALADRVTVLRNGRRVATTPLAGLDRPALVRQIVGRHLEERSAHVSVRRAETVLALNELTVDRVGPISFAVDRGEVVGLVGLVGSGHERIGRAIFGVLEARGGGVDLLGENLPSGDVAAAIGRRIGFISSNRGEESIAATLTVRENLFLHPHLGSNAHVQRMRPRAEQGRATEVLRQFDVQPLGAGEQLISGLSGGNQQKVVLARWLVSDCIALILEEPTMGVDVGAKLEIYRLLATAASRGTAILVISSDFEEVTRICDRVIVFAAGRVAGELGRDELDVAQLTALALSNPEVYA